MIKLLAGGRHRQLLLGPWEVFTLCGGRLQLFRCAFYREVDPCGGCAHGWIDYDASFSDQNKFSALVGVDIDLGKNFTANVQGTFVSRTALTIGASYSF